MASPTKYSTKCRGQHNYARFLLNAFLGVVLAFPLGIITASIEAVSLFGTILPISILLALIFPIVVPLIAVSGVLFASWHLITLTIHTLIDVGKTTAALAQKIPPSSQSVHILLHAHEIAYMGIYGMLVIFTQPVKPFETTETTEPLVTNISSFSSIRRRNRARLFIHDFPKLSIPVLPPTPPYSDASYTPSRSPTFTESTDTSYSFRTPVDEPAYTPLAQLSELLDGLKDEELSIVASYVEILKRGRSGSSWE